LIDSAEEPSSSHRPIFADVVGLALIALQFTVIFLWLVPDDGTRLPLGIVAYGMLGAVALSMWHGKETAKTLSNAYDWGKVVLGSIVLGCLSFGVDVLVGSSTHPGVAPLKAGTQAGSPFGFGLTLILCPGLTMIAIASIVRSFLVTNGDAVGG